MNSVAGMAKLADARDLKSGPPSLIVNEVRRPRAGVATVVASGGGGDLAATPQFCGTTSTLQIRKKKP
jgi:hypothetical protein